MKREYLKLLFTIIITASFIYSCSTSKETVEEKILPADRLIKKLEANRRKMKTFRGTGILKIESQEFSGKGNFEVILKKPDSIKISVYGPFGIDLAHGLVTKQSFLFYDVINQVVYKGANDRNVLKKIFKIDLSFEDLMDAFAGAVNLTGKLRREPDYYKKNDDNYILTYIDKKGKKKSEYKVDIESLALISYKLTTLGNDELLKGTFSDFKKFKDVPVPYLSLIVNDVKDQEVKIEYRNIEVNEKIGELNIALPRDVEIIRW